MKLFCPAALQQLYALHPHLKASGAFSLKDSSRLLEFQPRHSPCGSANGRTVGREETTKSCELVATATQDQPA